MTTGPAKGHGERLEEWDTVRGPGRGRGCARGDEASLLLGKKIHRGRMRLRRRQNNEWTCGWAPLSQHLGNSVLRTPRTSLLHVLDKAGVGVAESPVQPPL